ncbi:MAG: lipocalin-like domain-containing protein [Hyphomicrobiales bacterium]|nr:lipocalin-like domain-containing protein [Hyphomicrobiales bacterium]
MASEEERQEDWPEDWIVGVWGMVSQVYEDAETGETIAVFGEHPRGRKIATADGRWIALATAEGRAVPTNDEERAQALQSMIAYTGRYRYKDGKVIIQVEAAWNESWVGGEQVRHIAFEGRDLLKVRSAVMPHPNLPGRRVRVIVTWRREE